MKLKKFKENLLFQDKVSKLIPETYIIFEYESYNFFNNKNKNFLILGKIISNPYKHADNSFIDIKIKKHISNYYMSYERSSFNIDMITDIKLTSKSLKYIEDKFEEFSEDFKLKNELKKYNL